VSTQSYNARLSYIDDSAKSPVGFSSFSSGDPITTHIYSSVWRETHFTKFGEDTEQSSVITAQNVTDHPRSAVHSVVRVCYFVGQ